MRRNPMVRVRRYDQWPQDRFGWFVEAGDLSGFASGPNPIYHRDMRMQSWRRPL